MCMAVAKWYALRGLKATEIPDHRLQILLKRIPPSLYKYSGLSGNEQMTRVESVYNRLRKFEVKHMLEGNIQPGEEE